LSDNSFQVTLLSDVRSTIDNWIIIVDEVVYMGVQVKDKQYFDKFRGQIKTFKDRERQVIPPV
jgi:methyl-accepting chemotaxis protein